MSEEQQRVAYFVERDGGMMWTGTFILAPGAIKGVTFEFVPIWTRADSLAVRFADEQGAWRALRESGITAEAWGMKVVKKVLRLN